MSSLDIGLGISLVSIGIAAVNFLYGRFKVEADLDKRIAKLEDKEKPKDYIDDIINIKDRLTRVESREDLSHRLDMLCEDVRELKVKNSLIWGAVEKAMVDILHHPTEIERDALLEKLGDKTITLKEMEELELMLEDAVVKKKGKTEAIAATLLLAVVKQKQYDVTKSVEAIKTCL